MRGSDLPRVTECQEGEPTLRPAGSAGVQDWEHHGGAATRQVSVLIPHDSAGKECCAAYQLGEELMKWERREHQLEAVQFRGPGTYLAQDSEAWFRVQFWLFQLHHAYPAVFIQVLFIVVITQAQWVHLGGRQKESFNTQDSEVLDPPCKCVLASVVKSNLKT